MKQKRRKPNHPGVILEEHYIKPLNLNLEELAHSLQISRNTLYKIRLGKGRITADIALRLSLAFQTTPDLWLNLQQKFDLWELCHNSLPKIPQIYPPPKNSNVFKKRVELS